MSVDIQRIADRLGASLGRPIGVDDLKLRIIAYNSAGAVPDDEARRSTILHRRVPQPIVDWVHAHRPFDRDGMFVLRANPDLGLDKTRWGAVVRHDGRPVAFLWVLVPEGEGLTDAEQTEVLRAADAIGGLIGRQHLIDELRTLRERELLGDLLADDARARRDAADRLADSGHFDHQNASTVFVVRTLNPASPEPMRVARDRLDHAIDSTRMLFRASEFMATVRHGAAVIVVARPKGGVDVRMRTSADIGRAIEERFRELLGDEARPWVGMSRRVTDIVDLNRGYREARQAVDVSSSIQGIGSPAHYNRLGVYRRLAHLAWGDEERSNLHPGIQLLLEREAAGDPLARTLEAYLDNAGDAARSAEELHLHRASLYGRLRRIEKLATLDLSNGQDRLVAHLELKLARLMQVSSAETAIRQVSMPSP